MGFPECFLMNLREVKHYIYNKQRNKILELEIAQLRKCLLRHEDLSLSPRTHIKIPDSVVHIQSQSWRGGDKRDHWGLLASWSLLIGELQANERPFRKNNTLSSGLHIHAHRCACMHEDG